MMMETLPAGTILHGRYRIERVLGSGGFGHVYLAVDLHTNQQYAIKEYLVTGSSGKAQLEHEARVLSQLHHPSLPAFQVAFDERGRYYVVLGYIEGSDLTDYIRVARQKNEVILLQRIMTWVLSVCDAVAFLHSQNPPIIHRDIKPDNIRIMPNGTAMLVDLGNAKAAADGARTLFFIRHQGTPGYAPLEQYPGGSGTDVRSDVYALGGTLYFALTTHEPPSVSTRNQSLSQGLPDLPSLQEQLAQNPPETSAESEGGRQFRLGVSKPAKPVRRHLRHLAQLGTLPPELLDRLNSIIKQAMAMKPKDRYQSVTEFSHDLRLVLAALPASTQPPSTGAARPVDPHSTQPDLPLLYEAMQQQKAEGNAGQKAHDTASTAETPPVSPPERAFRCPRCTSELVGPAAFCPHCGTPLTNLFNAHTPGTQPPPSAPAAQANTSSPAPGNTAPAQDIADQVTMTYAPHQAQSPRPAPAPGSSSSPRSPVPRREDTTRGSSPSPAQFKTASSQPQLPRPFMPASGTASAASPGTKVVQKSPAPASASANNQPGGRADSAARRKVLILLFVVFVVVILLIATLVLFARVKSKGHHTSSTIHAGQPSSQVLTYERNVSLCIAATTPSACAGIWPRGSGFSSPAGIAERMDRPRARSTPGDQWHRLT